MAPIPKDEDLYESIKGDIFSRQKPSAYRSALLVKMYKKKYAELYGSKDAYYGASPNDDGLTRWFAEDWRNQRGEVGYKYKSDVYRPTRRVSPRTPRTFSEISSDELGVARRTKTTKGRVNRF